MGISSMPTPSEGMMTLLVMNTMLTVSIFKQSLTSALRFLRIRVTDPGSEEEEAAVAIYRVHSPPSAAERFRNGFKPVRFGPGGGRRRSAADRLVDDCRVCLAKFEADSMVNRLSCGHIFHRNCMEKWLEYHHLTCPLCRTFVLPGDDAALCTSASWPWF